MLIYNLKEGRDILIDGKTLVSVLSIKGNRVKIGFDAPAEVDITRPERLEAELADELGDPADE